MWFVVGAVRERPVTMAAHGCVNPSGTGSWWAVAIRRGCETGAGPFPNGPYRRMCRPAQPPARSLVRPIPTPVLCFVHKSNGPPGIRRPVLVCVGGGVSVCVCVCVGGWMSVSECVCVWEGGCLEVRECVWGRVDVWK